MSAASISNEFGYTDAGMGIVRLAEPTSVTVPNKFLPRARSIARNGGVTLTVEGRLVRSTVHRGADASVTHVEFAAPPGRSDDSASSQLTIATVDCSCPARTPMCVHVLATLYALAMLVDATPEVAVELRAVPAAAGIDDVGADQWVPLSAVDVANFYG